METLCFYVTSCFVAVGFLGGFFLGGEGELTCTKVDTLLMLPVDKFVCYCLSLYFSQYYFSHILGQIMQCKVLAQLCGSTVLSLYPHIELQF